MRKYEIMLVLPAEADEATVSGVRDRIAQVIGSAGGQVSSVDTWGRRRLAYEIEHHTEAYYMVVQCDADPASIRELERVLALADEVIRFKAVVREAA
jgi:small subunit ribosomal protein S6